MKTIYSVITFDPKYIPDFVALNREWIEKYFVVEKTDLLQLENPYESILDIGGEIFFILEGEKVVGTCAMIPHGPNSYELAKMAVSPGDQGRGFGDVLMQTAIEWAQAKKAHKVTLLSNTKLEPAITLYHKYGFKTIHLGTHPDYKRCNIEMELVL
jgi:GNAT superfamily N-acetyltransferase